MSSSYLQFAPNLRPYRIGYEFMDLLSQPCFQYVYLETNTNSRILLTHVPYNRFYYSLDQDIRGKYIATCQNDKRYPYAFQTNIHAIPTNALLSRPA